MPAAGIVVITNFLMPLLCFLSYELRLHDPQSVSFKQNSDSMGITPYNIILGLMWRLLLFQ